MPGKETVRVQIDTFWKDRAGAVVESAKPDTSHFKEQKPFVFPHDSSQCCEVLASLQDTSEFSFEKKDSGLYMKVTARLVNCAVDTFFAWYSFQYPEIHQEKEITRNWYVGTRQNRLFIGGTARLGIQNSYSAWAAVPMRKHLIKAGYDITNKRIEIGYGFAIY